MDRKKLIGGACGLALAGLAGGARAEVPPVYNAPPEQPAPQQFVYQQQPFRVNRELFSSAQASDIINRFKAAYGKRGMKVLVYVNRELVDEDSGMKLVGRVEATESARRTLAPGRGGGNTTVNANGAGVVAVSSGGSDATAEDKVTGVNAYRFRDRPKLSVTERQFVRDVESSFGRRLRSAGASLVDQKIATQMIGDRAAKGADWSSEGTIAKKDREAVARIADVVLELLVSSRSITVAGISGDHQQELPDIHATAIHVADSKVLGHASTDDLASRAGTIDNVASNFDSATIADGVALTLMNDMLIGQ